MINVQIVLLKNKTEIISVLSARVPSLGDFELKLYNDRTRIGVICSTFGMIVSHECGNLLERTWLV